MAVSPTRALVALSIALSIALAAVPAFAQGAAPGAPAGPTAAPWTPADLLRDGNAAATAGDWLTVSQLVDPLLRGQLPAGDLAEAHRLAGLAAFFQGRKLDAENHFVAYLKIDLDAQLDPALYPPEVLRFFDDIKIKYNAELRARRPKQKRYWILTLVPPVAQFQNGDRVKGIVIGGALATFLVANITTALVLRSWCTRVSGPGGSSLTCDNGASNHYANATTMRGINGFAGVAAILTYAYGVYDGVKNFRRQSREAATQPFVSSSEHGDALFGVAGRF